MQPSHVLIDGFNLSLEMGTGVATYARNLSLSLRDLGHSVGILYGSHVPSKYPPLLKEVLFFDAPPPVTTWRAAFQRFLTAFLPARNTAEEIPVSGAVLTRALATTLPHFDTLWNAQHLYTKALAQFDFFGLTNQVRLNRRPLICHWTYPLPVYVPGVPNVYTVHDLVPLRLPYTTLDKKNRYLKLLQWICRTADHIVTVSENSKRDIVELLGVSPDRVTNTYQTATIPKAYLEKAEDTVRREVEGTFGLTYQDYFLFFGSIEPKKNIGRLLEAYLGSGVKTPLVILGARAWKADKELSLLDVEAVRHELRDGSATGGRIIRFSYAPFSLLVSLIRGAKAVLFPSLYEGFGLPVLEAMTLGTPVLTSSTSAIPEVAGDAALLIDPYRPQEIAEQIRALDEDTNLRARLSDQGRRRARLFDSASYQRRLAEVYNHVARTHKRCP